MSLINRCIGAQLRALRKQRQWTLHDAQVCSNERWKQSVLGSYERAERTLSLPQYVELCRFYGADPARILERALAAVAVLEDLQSKENAQ